MAMALPTIVVPGGQYFRAVGSTDVPWTTATSGSLLPSRLSSTGQRPTASFSAVAAALLVGGARQCRQRRSMSSASRRSKVTRNMYAVPTEFYSLLGLPIFTSDKKEIKAAHRRCIKLAHPDICGGDTGAILNLVTQAYETLRDDDDRKAYDKLLKKAKPSLAESRWSDDAPDDLRGAFVDETKCIRCYKCVDFASSTFGIHPDPAREEKAHVVLQFGDAIGVVRSAVNNCPANAIRWVTREDLPLIEYAMAKSARMRKRARTAEEREEVPGPEEMMQDFMIDKLIEMDMETAKAEFEDPTADSRQAEELSDKAREIYQAARDVPDEVKAKLWPESTANLAAQEAALDKKKQKDPVDFVKTNTAVAPSTPGMQRAQLKATAFKLFDRDGDGYLHDAELKRFALELGFDGGAAEWAQEYTFLCNELNCYPVEGVDLRAFSRLLDDEDTCYMSDDELVSMLNDSKELPRAGQ